MSKDVYVFIEQRGGKVQKVGLELLGRARGLAEDLGQQVVGVMLGKSVAKRAAMVLAHGADKVVLVENDMLEHYVTEPYTKAVTAIIGEYAPEIFLFGATSIGRDLAPRVAARVHTGLTADCTGLSVNEETKLLHMTRPAFGGNIMAEIVCANHRPQMATVRPGVMQALEADAARQGEVIDFKVDFLPGDMNIEILRVEESQTKSVDITEAPVLVSGGRGVGGPEGYAALHELAAELGGEVAASRVCVDSGWIEKDRQVGQTGKTVRPGVYLALGISGAIQHLAGMEESETIIAVNKDATAPMMDAAALGVVGDVKEIVPKLTAAIRKAKAAQAVAE